VETGARRLLVTGEGPLSRGRTLSGNYEVEHNFPASRRQFEQASRYQWAAGDRKFGFGGRRSPAKCCRYWELLVKPGPAVSLLIDDRRFGAPLNGRDLNQLSY
jgi:hypothetical protein